MSEEAPLLRMTGMEKVYPGVKALAGVDLVLNRGEVLALMGENGAGKSTLMKVLGGAIRADAGTIELEGERAEWMSPLAARVAGVAMIHQELNLIPGLSVRENLFLGQERRGAGWIDAEWERMEAVRLLGSLGLEVDPETRCGDLSVAQQQGVEIARALSLKARILVLDEPTAALSTREVERLFGLIRELKGRGMGLIYIGHRLDEIAAIADRVMVLRDGRNVGEGRLEEMPRNRIIEMMVGRSIHDEYPKREGSVGEVMLEVRGLGRGRVVDGVAFQVKRGEIVALAGLVGAGRTEVARLIFGADEADRGEIWVGGRRVAIRSPRDAIAAGIGFLTEDRKQQGLILGHGLLENFGLPNLNWLAPGGWVQRGVERESFDRFAGLLKIKLTDPNQRAGSLSGGNQQKIVMAKWLARQCEVLIFDEPTRGIDVGARYEIYRLMNQLSEEGKAILMISSELPEVMGMADRIVVMQGGKVAAELENGAGLTQEEILLQMLPRAGSAGRERVLGLGDGE